MIRCSRGSPVYRTPSCKDRSRVPSWASLPLTGRGMALSCVSCACSIGAWMYLAGCSPLAVGSLVNASNMTRAWSNARSGWSQSTASGQRVAQSWCNSRVEQRRRSRPGIVSARSFREEYRSMQLGLSDKVAIVTGGSGGLGTAVVRTLAREGAAVMVSDLDGTNGERLAESVGRAGDRAASVHLAVTREDR